MTRLMILLLIGLGLQARVSSCPPPGRDRAALETLKSKGFEVSDDAERQSLALALVACLSDPDPALRDGIAFEAYYTWMRAKKLDLRHAPNYWKQLGDTLEPGQTDGGGFASRLQRWCCRKWPARIVSSHG
jgi:hypothetical protein